MHIESSDQNGHVLSKSTENNEKNVELETNDLSSELIMRVSLSEMPVAEEHSGKSRKELVDLAALHR